MAIHTATGPIAVCIAIRGIDTHVVRAKLAVFIGQEATRYHYLSKHVSDSNLPH